MKTVKYNSSNELIVKNSKFITLLFNIDEDFDIDNTFNIIKQQYPKATHYCYAYIMEDIKKCSDDGEPGGTAGMPMLNVLEKENMINTLAITIRYFGGIKLGAGGLVRAYSKSVKQALGQANIVEVEKGFLIRITTSYDEQKNLEYLLRKYVILNKEYLLDVVYDVLLPKNDLEIINSYNYQIINERYIEKVL